MMRSIIKRILFRILPSSAFDSLVVTYWRVRNWFSQSYEPERDRVGVFISNGDWVVDIGVNMGQYTSHFKSLVSKRGKVIGFEASKATFSLTRRIVGGLPAELHNLAIGSEDRILTISRYTGDAGMINHGISRIGDGTDPRASETEQV